MFPLKLVLFYFLFYHSENMYWVTLNMKIKFKDFLTPLNPPVHTLRSYHVTACIEFCWGINKTEDGLCVHKAERFSRGTHY